MRDYLVTVLLVSAVTAVLGILPSDEKLKKTVSLSLSLILLSAVVLPLPALLSDLPRDYAAYLEELDGEIQSGSDYLEEKTLDAVGEGIAAHLAERYGIKRGAISVAVSGDIVDSTVILRHVAVSLAPSAQTADVRSIIYYVEENTNAECEVIYLEK